MFKGGLRLFLTPFRAANNRIIR